MRLASIFALVLVALTSKSGPIEITGKVAANDNIAKYEFNVPFHILIDGNKWQIDVQFENYKELCWCDGAKVSSFDVFPEDKGDPMLSRADVSPGTYPFFSGTTVSLIWLAFASSEYLQVNTNTMPALWKAGFSDPTCEAHVIKNLEFISDKPLLPSGFDFVFSRRALTSLTNMHYLSKSVSTFALEKTYHDYELLDNFLMAHYAAASITNVDRLKIPTEFDLVVYGYDNVQTNHQKIHQKFHGKVESIVQSAVEPDIPAINYPIWVDDHQFTDARTRVDSIGYVVSNKDWPPMTDPALQALFQETKARHSTNLPVLNESNARLLPLFLVIFTVVSFPLFIFVRWIKGGNKNNPPLTQGK